MGTAYGALLPYQTFQTKTRDIAIGIGSDKLWRTFCPLLGLRAACRRSALRDQRRAQRQPAVAHRRAAGSVSGQTYEEWEAILLPAGIPMGAINTIDAVVEHPQVRPAARWSSASIRSPARIRMIGPPVRMSETPGAVRAPAPLLGEHTDEVLKNRLGLSDDEIATVAATNA